LTERKSDECFVAMHVLFVEMTLMLGPLKLLPIGDMK
jgi:hypothetical protein